LSEGTVSINTEDRLGCSNLFYFFAGIAEREGIIGILRASVRLSVCLSVCFNLDTTALKVVDNLILVLA